MGDSYTAADPNLKLRGKGKRIASQSSISEISAAQMDN